MARSETTDMSWSELVEYSRTSQLHAKNLYLLVSEPTNGLGPVLENLDPHVAYQTQLERDGVMFAAGPLASEDQQRWNGEGIFVYRAESLEQAQQVADADPMHQAGARRYRVRLWLLNEGTYYQENI